MLKSIYHFFRLIRVLNLIVIGLTMTVVELFLLSRDSFPNRTKTSLDLYSFDEMQIEFYIILFSTLLIAAAGNIINDYFDVKADRVNKPNRLIIGKYIKRRWAMVLHWSFNLLGFVLALYIGYVLQNVWIPIVSFLSINLLWFYSAYFKRKPLIGNVMVALLLGVIPFYVLIFNESNLFTVKEYFFKPVMFISLIAFLMNFVRELVKDIQDIRGDLRLNAQTFPIKFGVKRTKNLIVFISFILLLTMLGYFYVMTEFEILYSLQISISRYFFYFLILSAGVFLVSLIITTVTNKIKGYKIASLLLKLSMVLGLLTPLFL